MSNHDSVAGQLEALIDSVVLPMEEAGVDIDPVFVAAQVDRLIDPGSVSPALKTYASVMQIRGMTRKRLARRHDPVERANEFAAEGTGDLFEGSLQPYYPAKRPSEDGAETIYVRREKLTDIDVQAIAARMSKAGESLMKHARALLAWHMGRAAA